MGAVAPGKVTVVRTGTGMGTGTHRLLDHGVNQRSSW